MARTATVEAKAEAPDWKELLVDAIHEPGKLQAAHRYFHTYSLLNRWLAAVQLSKLGLPLMPINTFNGWKNANRMVQKGEKSAISLVMPVPKKVTTKDEVTGEEEKKTLFMRFLLAKRWFHMGQTEGEDYALEEKSTEWDLKFALEAFSVSEVEFTFANVSDLRMGDATAGTISVSPMETHPTYGKIRQLSRIVLGHLAVEPGKSVPPDEPTRVLEAETTAYLVAATLGLTGVEESRQVLQDAMFQDGKMRIPDKSANRAFAAADKILNAGSC